MTLNKWSTGGWYCLWFKKYVPTCFAKYMRIPTKHIEISSPSQAKKTHLKRASQMARKLVPVFFLRLKKKKKSKNVNEKASYTSPPKKK